MMMKKLRRLSIAAQAHLALTAVLLAVVGAFYFWSAANAEAAELAHARTVADMADSFRKLAAKHGGFYVRRSLDADITSVGRYLTRYTSAPGADGNASQFFHKNPFLALTDYSQVVGEASAGAKFTMVSDNYMNPANQPDLTDLEAILRMRGEGFAETWKVVNGTFRYARALKAEQACLTCHGAPESAPAVVTAQYKPPIGSSVGGGYGYTDGQVVGITSVRLDHSSPWSALKRQPWHVWGSLGVLLSIYLAVHIAVLRGIVNPLRSLTSYSRAIVDGRSIADCRPPVLDADEHSSANELHKQSDALKALHESLDSAMAYVNQAQPGGGGHDGSAR